MTEVEILLILVGLVLIFGSFFIQEKLSPKDVEEITRLSEREMKIIVERQLADADGRIDEAIDEAIERSAADTKRMMEKETNEKIMAIDEYSNTVIESMNKTHNEIVFLYNMLNDKHTELTGLASELQQFSDKVKTGIRQAAQPKAAEPQQTAAVQRQQPRTAERRPQPQPEPELEMELEPEAAPAEQTPKASAPKKEKPVRQDAAAFNEKVLSLHQNGVSDVEIAKQLGRGLGEVRLVIGLYKGEDVSEI